MNSSYDIIFCFIAICFLQVTTPAPQIFSEVYELCKHEFTSGVVTVPNKIWTVSDTNKKFVIHFSLCPSLSNNTLESICKKKTSSCMINRNGIVDLGSSLSSVLDFDDFVLKSNSGFKCPSSKSENYTLTVNFHCMNSDKPGARLISEDDCNFEVDMMGPHCEPKCTSLIANSYLVDLRLFRKNLEVESNNRTFHLTPCGPTRTCGQQREITACEVVNGEFIPLAKGESQLVNYDLNKNALTIRGRYKLGRVLRKVEVLVKCNWDSDFTNLTYKNVGVPSKNYKFEVESNFGCVKLPHSCVTMGLDGLKYNLTRLNKPQGWTVRNVTDGNKQLILNICGQLKQKTPNNVCSAQYSQICEISGRKFVNKGSILSNLDVDDDIVKAVFGSGSVCEEDSNLRYKTEIRFKCSSNEMGPILEKTEHCTMFINWLTPEACPFEYYEGDNCRISDILNSRNLQGISSNEDKVHSLTVDTNLTYNLCGPLNTKCLNFTDVNFCLRSPQGDFVIGWMNTHLISDHTNLKMSFEGDLCSNSRNTGKISVDFICSFENPPPPPTIIVVENNCQFKMTVFTFRACSGDNNFSDCKLKKDQRVYDLTPLSLKSKNYVISDIKNGRQFSLNVCGPIITDENTKCRGNTMVCFHDQKKENVKDQFISIGGVSGPQWHNNSLVIRSTIGDYCGGYGHYKTEIRFECSTNEGLPRLEGKRNCSYEFVWPTKYACPKDTCVVSDLKTHALLDINKIEQQRLKISMEDGLKYKFDLCKNYYTECKHDSCHEKNISMQFVQDSNQIILDLNKACFPSKSYDFNRIVFHLECNRILHNEYFEKKSVIDCVLSIVLKTQSVCPFGTRNGTEQHISDVPPQITKIIESITKSTIISKNESNLIVPYNCSLTNQFTGYNYLVSNISTFSDSKNELNFDGKSSNCDGIWCRGKIEVLKFSQKCPKVIYNYTNSLVQMQFSSEINCPNTPNSVKYNLEIALICSSLKSKAKFIKSDQCNLIIHLDSPQACELLKKEIHPTSMGALIGGVTAGISVLLAIGVFALFCGLKTRRRKSQYSHFESKKDMVPIYYKDSTE